ncbi:MAG TPA: hypothetical protein VF486_27020 [Actinomycetes bacterium]
MGDPGSSPPAGGQAPPDCARARFPEVAAAAPHYESFYLKACAPGGGLGLWLRYTVLKPPDGAPAGALWCTLFDAAAPGPVAVKQTLGGDRLARPDGGYVRIGESLLTPDRADGSAAAGGTTASWGITLEGGEPALAHLPRAWLYGTPLPRTKLCSPRPAVRATGAAMVGGRSVELDGWPAMVGHNWGAEHAERWVWLHGSFGGGAWLDVAVARVRLGRWVSPWLASGALSLDGARHRLGGPGRWAGLLQRASPGTSVVASPEGCRFELPGRGLRLRGVVRAERKDVVGWVYADPAGGSHDTLNCSIATMELTAWLDGRSRTLRCAGGAAYELGTRDHDHGIPLQPYPDGQVAPER